MFEETGQEKEVRDFLMISANEDWEKKLKYFLMITVMNLCLMR